MKSSLSGNRIMKHQESAGAFRRWSVSIASSSACLLCLGLGVLLSQGCAKERGITPVPTKYRAVLLTSDTYTYQEYVARMLDLSTGAVAGEIPIDVGFRIPEGITVTPDGRYGAAFHGKRVQVYDLQSLTLAHELSWTSPIISSLHFLPVGSLKLLVCCRVSCTTGVYDLSAGAIDTLLPGARLAFSSPDQSELVTISSGGVTRRSYDTWEIIDSFSFVSPAGGRVLVYSAEVLPSYDGIYLLGSDAGGDALFRYNLSDHSCSFRQPLLPNSEWRKFALSPDGREIWVIQFESWVLFPPGGGTDFEFSEYILILDGSTGAPRDTIRTIGLREQAPEYPVGMVTIAFHPEEQIVYIATEALSMLAINRTSREIFDTIDVGYVREILISPSSNTSAHTR